MRTSWLLVFAGILAACSTSLTIAPDGDPGTTGDGGVEGDGAKAGDAGLDGSLPGIIPGAPCDRTEPCRLVTSRQIASIAVQDEYVYFTQYEAAGAIWRVPKGGGSAEVVVPAQKLPSSLFATADDLYWLNEGDNGVAHRPAAAPSAVAIKNSGSMLARGQITAFGTRSYWTAPAIGNSNGGTVHVSDGFVTDQTLLPSLEEPTAIAADASYVYFAMKNGTTDQQVYRFSAAGADGELAAQVYQGVHAIAVSATGVVAVASDSVMGHSTTFPGLFIEALKGTAAAKGIGVLHDDASMMSYFLTTDGRVHRAADGVPGVAVTTATDCSDGRAIAQDARYLYLACMTSIWRVQK